jgi:hypothetical protein
LKPEIEERSRQVKKDWRKKSGKPIPVVEIRKYSIERTISLIRERIITKSVDTSIQETPGFSHQKPLNLEQSTRLQSPYAPRSSRPNQRFP